MEQNNSAKINNANRKFVNELNEKLPDAQAKYSYHYSKGRFVHGYDGEAGFANRDNKIATLEIFGEKIVRETNNFKDEFGVFSLKDIRRFLNNNINSAKDDLFDYNGSKRSTHDEVNSRIKTLEDKLLAFNQAFPQKISKSEAIEDFKKVEKLDIAQLSKFSINLKDEEFEHLRNDKEVVLEAYKVDSRSIRFASQEIQELCEGKDPIKTLESAIAYDKMKERLSPVKIQDSKLKMKI